MIRRCSILLSGLLYCVAVLAQAPRFVTEDWPPFNYREAGVAKGIAIDLLAEAQKRLQTATPVEFLPWDRAYLVATEQPNVLIFTMGRRPERESLFEWVFPIHPRATYFYRHRSRPDVRVATLADARRWVVGTAGDKDAGTLDLLAAGFEKGKNLVMVREGDVSKAKMLAAGRIDLLVAGDHQMPITARTAGLDPRDFERLAPLSSQGEYWFAYSKGTPPERVERLRKVFQGMRDDGSFSAIKRRYLD